MLLYVLPAIPGVLTIGALSLLFVALRRQRRLKAVWAGGIVAEGRCVRSYVTTTVWRRGPHHSASRSLSHVYEFTTPDGRTRRFEEEGSATVFEGERVLIRYPAGRPDRATAHPPGDRQARAQARLRIGFAAFATLLCLGATAVFLTVTSVFTEARDKVGQVDESPLPAPPAPPDLPAPPGFPPLNP
ncbi:DUF3592 domain-containing protein [Streptomyces sp. NPDC046261]|uniref:DUF3592 domain-containing protein n=1 Tax=Streptomyces sp. NPDC046261 TaxID=3157200 RepID=UPI0033BFD559